MFVLYVVTIGRVSMTAADVALIALGERFREALARAHGCLARVGAADAGRARGSQRQHGRARRRKSPTLVVGTSGVTSVVELEYVKVE